MAKGSLTVITGPVFAGKTKKLIAYYQELKSSEKKLLAFKPVADKRYSDTEIVSHNGEKVPALAVKNVDEITNFLDKDIEIILIDEVQLFFSDEVISYLNGLVKEGKEIIATGLDWNAFEDAPINSVAGLLAAADKVIKLAGTCDICGDKAVRTQWKMDYFPQKQSDYVGGSEKYGCRCLIHYYSAQVLKSEVNQIQEQETQQIQQIDYLKNNS